MNYCGETKNTMPNNKIEGSGFSENEREHVPTPEEVHSLFKQLTKGREYEVTKNRNDAKGLYELEIEVRGETPGETTEYEYRREFVTSKNPEIHVVYYKDDEYIHGTSAARCIKGKWKLL